MVAVLQWVPSYNVTVTVLLGRGGQKFKALYTSTIFPCSPPETLKEAITFLDSRLQPKEFKLEVRRECLMDDLMGCVKKGSFHPLRKVTTYFVGRILEG